MKKNLIYIITLSIALIATSCSDWLDVKPQGETEREQFYDSEEGFQKALVGCYMKLKSTDLYGLAMTATTIEYPARHWLPTNDAETALADLKTDNQDLKDAFNKIYKGEYNAIAQTNDLLSYLAKKGDVIKNENLRKMIQGEALAIRAFCHFDVLRIFGQWPTDPTIKVSLPYVCEASVGTIPYYTFEQFTEKLLTDLSLAETLLKESDPLMKYSFDELNAPQTLLYYGDIPNDFFAYRKTRLNYYAVRALMARVYLYTGNYTKAHEYALSVLNAKDAKGNKAIKLKVSDISDYYYTLPNETLFNLHVYNLADYMNDLFRNTDYALSSRLTTEAGVLSEVFNNVSSDARRTLWYEQVSRNGIKQTSIKKYWQMHGETGAGVTQQVVPLIRLAEMYLIAIESSALDEANTWMREYKTSRNISPTDYPDATSKEQLKEELLKEYRREFWGEGQMFFAYKRLGVLNMMWGVQNLKEENYIIPLPSTEINNTKN